MMLQKKGSSFFYINAQFHIKNPLKQRPETIPGMSIKEAIFSGLDRGKGTQDQNF